MKNSICLCSLCKKPSFDHSKQDEKDAFIICENCEDFRHLTKTKKISIEECGVCYKTNNFFIKLPNCKHLLCRDCCFRICFYDESLVNENTCYYQSMNPVFPIEYTDKKGEYETWFEENDDNDWYRSEMKKYNMRRNRKSWMNNKSIIKYEDLYIQYIILDELNCKIRQDIEYLEQKQIVCPFCRNTTEVFR